MAANDVQARRAVGAGDDTFVPAAGKKRKPNPERLVLRGFLYLWLGWSLVLLGGQDPLVRDIGMVAAAVCLAGLACSARSD